MAFLWLSTSIFYFISLIVQAQGKVKQRNTLSAFAVFEKSSFFFSGGRVTRISPVSGSVRGATRLTIFGEGK